MSTLRIFLRTFGVSTDLTAIVTDSKKKVVKDVGRANVSVGLSADGMPLSVRIRDVQNLASLKDIVARNARNEQLTKRQLDHLGKLCLDNMAKLEAAYRSKHAVVEFAACESDVETCPA